MQNWNAGKAQEFKDRLVYSSVAKTELTGEPLLFTTPTCPNCQTAKVLLDHAGIDYELIDASERPELAEEYDVVSAPSLIVGTKEGIKKLTSIPEIRAYCQQS